MKRTNNIFFIRRFHQLLNDHSSEDSNAKKTKEVSNSPSDTKRIELVDESLPPSTQRHVKKVNDTKLVLKQNYTQKQEYEKLVEATQTIASQGLIRNGAGNAIIDQQIAVGFLQVNTGKIPEALMTFQSIINSTNPAPLAAILGKGTALALSGEYKHAISDFTSAIQLYPNSEDAWKRRGQARAAQGNLTDAINDLTRSSQLVLDGDVLFQRGLVYYKQKNYKRALQDFLRSIKLDDSNAQCYNQIGLCFTATGRCWDVSIHHKSDKYQTQY